MLPIDVTSWPRHRVGVVAAEPWLQPCAIAGDRPQERIKIGQIGTEHEHASGKMETFRKLTEHYEVVGIVESDPALRKKHEKDPVYRDLKWMTEEELFNTKGLQAVAVETKIRDLVPTAARCIAAGMHMHLDKPGSETIGPFKKLLDEAGRRGLAVQLGYMYRNNPAIQFCLRAVREGWLGQVFEVHAVMSRKDSLAYRTWLGQFPGGAMYNLRLPHDRSGGEPARQARPHHALLAPDAVRREGVRQRPGGVRVSAGHGHDPHRGGRSGGLSAAAVGRVRRPGNDRHSPAGDIRLAPRRIPSSSNWPCPARAIPTSRATRKSPFRRCRVDTMTN